MLALVSGDALRHRATTPIRSSELTIPNAVPPLPTWTDAEHDYPDEVRLLVGAMASAMVAPEKSGQAKIAFQDTAALDLRGLNETMAGDGGFIVPKGMEFVHSKTGEAVRLTETTTIVSVR